MPENEDYDGLTAEEVQQYLFEYDERVKQLTAERDALRRENAELRSEVRWFQAGTLDLHQRLGELSRERDMLQADMVEGLELLVRAKERLDVPGDTLSKARALADDINAYLDSHRGYEKNDEEEHPDALPRHDDE